MFRSVPNNYGDAHRRWLDASKDSLHSKGRHTPLVSEGGRSSEVRRNLVEQMGSFTLEPFDERWLSNFPMVLDHVVSEHILHVKGVDDSGLGLSWHETKFDSSADNPLLRPEQHFQMKVGYFLIPEEYILKNFAAPNASVLHSLYTKLDGQDYFKFPVHPDAYEHYCTLIPDALVVSAREDISTLSKEGLQGKKLVFVSSDASELMGTPTSSYRSWVLRDLSDEDSLPFIAKVGVPCQVLGSDRWLSEAEIERSVNCQRAFDEMLSSPPEAWGKDGSRFLVFPESLGVVISHPFYRSSVSKHSGLLIREFPKEVLKGHLRIASCAALMSVQGAKGGELPWISHLIRQAIERGECSSAREFMSEHFVKNYLDAIEPVIMREGLTIEPHSQNLCVLLSPEADSRLVGFAYRDHGGIWVDLASRVIRNQRVDFFACGMLRHEEIAKPLSSKQLVKAQGALDRAYIQSYAWFYRYQVMVKMFNSILSSKETERWRPSSAPYQLGFKEPIDERVLQPYLQKQFTNLQLSNPLSAMPSSISRLDAISSDGGGEITSHEALRTSKPDEFDVDTSSSEEGELKLSARRVDHIAQRLFSHCPSVEEAEDILIEMDSEYVRRLERYFIIEELSKRLPMPAVEGGISREDKTLTEIEDRVGKYHKFFGSWKSYRAATHLLEPWNCEILERCDLKEAVTYDGQELDLEKVTHYCEKSSGILLYNKNEEGACTLIAVIPKI